MHSPQPSMRAQVRPGHAHGPARAAVSWWGLAVSWSGPPAVSQPQLPCRSARAARRAVPCPAPVRVPASSPCAPNASCAPNSPYKPSARLRPAPARLHAQLGRVVGTVTVLRYSPCPALLPCHNTVCIAIQTSLLPAFLNHNTLGILQYKNLVICPYWSQYTTVYCDTPLASLPLL